MTKQRIEVIARGVLIQRNSVLLCKNLKHGYLYLPGGHVEFGESAADALAREFVEETGLSCRAGPLIVAHEEVFEQGGRQRHEVNLVFHVEHLEGIADLDQVPSREPQIAFEWLDLAGAASADIRPASVRAWLASGGKADATAAWWSVGADPGPGDESHPTA